ncbi:MAG TPA: pitrilysin family protein, partial [Spirochaetota bacterium]|nr:pitrilysin family protein [Spirochaetota bacterium]
MRKKSALFLAAAVVLLCGVQHAGAKNKTVKHPSLLSYEKLDWKIPEGKESRVILKNGIKLYIAEDKTLPLISMGVIIKSGSILDVKGKEGLSSLFAVLMRRGGVNGYSPEKIDEILARYSINIGFNSDNDSLVFAADFLSEYSDTAFDIIEKMLFNPSFDDNILAKEKAIASEYVKYRFDDPESLLGAAYIKAMYSGSIIAGLADEKSIEAITRKDLINYHSAVMKNENMIIYISGNFDKNDMTGKLEKIFSSNTNKSNTPIDFPSVAVNTPNKCLIIDRKIS